MRMGCAAAGKLRRAVDGLTCALAIEVLAAVRAIHLRAPQSAGVGVGRGRRPAASLVPGPDEDHLASEIDAAVALAAGTRLSPPPSTWSAPGLTFAPRQVPSPAAPRPGTADDHALEPSISAVVASVEGGPAVHRPVVVHDQ